MRLAVLSFAAIFCLACSPIRENPNLNQTIDGDVVGTSDSSVAVDANNVDANNVNTVDANSVPAGDLGGPCLSNSTCSGDLVCDEQKLCVTPPCVPSNIIYLNREGGIYTKGIDDSQTNTTSTIPGGPGSAKTLEARTILPAVWAQVLSNTRMKLAAYDVLVVDQDPGSVPHLEIVITDTTGAEFGYQGVTGISPGCQSHNSIIGFEFKSTINIPLATSIASRIGVTLGLSYTNECGDLMSWSLLCLGENFTDESLTCGQNTAVSCRCASGATEQNSHQSMIEKLGARVCD